MLCRFLVITAFPAKSVFRCFYKREYDNFFNRAYQEFFVENVIHGRYEKAYVNRYSIPFIDKAFKQ